MYHLELVHEDLIGVYSWKLKIVAKRLMLQTWCELSFCFIFLSTIILLSLELKMLVVMFLISFLFSMVILNRNLSNIISPSLKRAIYF